MKVGWHQDQRYWTKGVQGDDLCTVWMPFVKVNKKNGCMKIIPQSNRSYIRKDSKVLEDDGTTITKFEVAVSNEIGQPRYPSSRRMIQSRRNPPTVFRADELLPDPVPKKMSIKLLTVPEVQGDCEIIEGADPKEKATNLLQNLRERGALNA